MQEEVLVEVDCVCFKVSSRLASTPSLQLMEYSGGDFDMGRPLKGGRFEIIKENVIAKEYLTNGKGVCFQNTVYFQKDGMDQNEHYLQFKKVYDATRLKIEKKCELQSEQFLKDHVADVHQIPIIKCIVDLKEKGFFDSQTTFRKLSVYLSETAIAELVHLMYQEKAVA